MYLRAGPFRIRKSSKVCAPGLSSTDRAASRRSINCWTVICNGRSSGWYRQPTG